MWEALVAAIVKGLIEPLIQWFATYRQGRLAERTENLENALETQKKLDDAREDIRSRHRPLPPDYFLQQPIPRGSETPSDARPAPPPSPDSGVAGRPD